MIIITSLFALLAEDERCIRYYFRLPAPEREPIFSAIHRQHAGHIVLAPALFLPYILFGFHATPNSLLPRHFSFRQCYRAYFFCREARAYHAAGYYYRHDFSNFTSTQCSQEQRFSATRNRAASAHDTAPSPATQALDLQSSFQATMMLTVLYASMPTASNIICAMALY